MVAVNESISPLGVFEARKTPGGLMDDPALLVMVGAGFTFVCLTFILKGRARRGLLILFAILIFGLVAAFALSN